MRIKTINGIEVLIVEVPKDADGISITPFNNLSYYQLIDHQVGFDEVDSNWEPTIVELPELQTGLSYMLMPDDAEEFVKAIYPDARIWEFEFQGLDYYAVAVPNPKFKASRSVGEAWSNAKRSMINRLVVEDNEILLIENKQS